LLYDALAHIPQGPTIEKPGQCTENIFGFKNLDSFKALTCNNSFEVKYIPRAMKAVHMTLSFTIFFYFNTICKNCTESTDVNLMHEQNERIRGEISWTVCFPKLFNILGSILRSKRR
jgi:hypothetical protein